MTKTCLAEITGVPQRPETTRTEGMRAFWWFEENAIAGMARPGFNCSQWFDLPFDEAVLVGWLGLHSSGSTSRQAFHDHVRDYAAAISKFYHLEVALAKEATEVLLSRSGLLDVLKRTTDRSQLLEAYDVTEDGIHFEFSRKRLDWEIEYLKSQGIAKIVSLTESHHARESLQEHFDCYHFSINDLGAPSLGQVHQMVDIIGRAGKTREKLAVHCLAGIGRTSTVLLAARLAMGEDLGSLKARIARQNPSFVFSGKQAEFIEAFSGEIKLQVLPSSRVE